MSSLFAFLDDIAVLAKAMAAGIDDIVAGTGKVASKSIAVVIDDAAVTPQYVQGISPARELPVIWRIAKGSLVNKSIIIVAIMLLAAVIPWIFPWALLLGGCYLVYEGAEKIVHRISHKAGNNNADHVLNRSPKDEQAIVRNAKTTDFVLSAEIMLISVNALESDLWWMRLFVLILTALLMTALVYGSVALLVKFDDFGRWITEMGVKKGSGRLRMFGVRLAKLMPIIFMLLSVVGVAAMLWVGGHLLVVNFAEVGLSFFADISHSLTQSITNGVLFWCADAFIAGLFGLAVGLIIATISAVIKKICKTHKKRVASA